jgi:cell division protein FtsX
MSTVAFYPERDLRIWTIYENARDVPDARYSARLSIVRKDGIVTTDLLIKSDNIETLREGFEDEGLVKIDRAPTDDAVIVEVWL